MRFTRKCLVRSTPIRRPGSKISQSFIRRWATTPKPNPSTGELWRFGEKPPCPDHPDTAKSLEILAQLCYAMGDYAKAEFLYRRALEIREKVLGPEHPDTAGVLNKLPCLNVDLAEVGGALEYAVRAGKAQETRLGNILSFTSEQQRLALFKRQPILSRFLSRWAARLILPKPFCTTKVSCSIHCSKTG